MQRRTFTLGVASTALGVAAPAIVRADYYDAELCLMLDCSPSMYGISAHYAVQRQGHYQALLSNVVQSALLQWQPLVAVYAWANMPELLVERQVKTVADVELLAKELFDKTPASETGGDTKHREVLEYFHNQPAKGMRRIIDFSTDEAPRLYTKEDCRRLSDELYLSGTQINLLSIDRDGTISEVLDQYMKTPNGFVKQIEDFSGYEEGIKQKLQRDLAV